MPMRIREFLEPLRSVKKEAAILTGVALVVPTLNASFAYALTPISKAISEGDFETVKIWMFSLCALYAIGLPFIFAFRGTYAPFDFKIETFLTRKHAKELTLLENRFFETYGASRVMNVFTAGISTWRENLGIVVSGAVFTMAYVIGSAINIFVISPAFFAVFFVTFAAFIA